MAHRPRPHRIQYFEEFGMQGRLAAGKLDEIGLTFAGDEGIHHAFHGGQRQVFAARRRGVGKANRAGEIAMLVDFNQRQARMLLVIGTQAAIVRAAEFGVALPRQRSVAGLDVVLAQLPIGYVRRDQRGMGAVTLAALFVPDLVVLDGDFRRHQLKARLAQRGGLAPEHIRTRSTQRRDHRRFLDLVPLRSWQWHTPGSRPTRDGTR